MKRRLPLYDASKHLPFGTFGYYSHMGLPLLTNAKREYIVGHSRHCVFDGEITVRDIEDGYTYQYSGSGVHTMPSAAVVEVLQHCGFALGGEYEGKFVFMKDGTFFLAHKKIPHFELMELLGIHDRVAVLSAGFVTVYPGRIDLHGESESLKREPYFVPLDVAGIAQHLGMSLSKELEAELD
jgi:hypothetical protein